MQVILLSAGESSRMLPLTQGKHKTHLRILGKSILQHSIESFLDAGFKDIVVVVSPHHALENVLDESIRDKVQFVSQPKPLGVGDALVRAKDCVDDVFLVCNAYHIATPSLVNAIRNAKDMRVFITETKEFWKYGMVRIEDSKVVDIEEKPKKWDTPYRLLGFYVLTKSFLDRYGDALRKNHYSFEYVLKDISNKEGIYYTKYDYRTPSLKYPWDYISYFEFLISHLYPESRVYGADLPNADTSKGAVVVDEGAVIEEDAVIKGPAYIGKEVYVGNKTLIRGSNVESNSIIGYASEIARSVLQPHAKVHGSYIGDSIIGENFSSGFGFVTTNRRLDRKTVDVVVNGRVVNSGKTSLGVVCGDNVAIGSHAVTMPGCVIESGSVLYPQIRVKGVVKGVVKNSNF